MDDSEAQGGRADTTALRGLAAFVGGYAVFDALPVLLGGGPVVEGIGAGDLIDAPLVFLLVGVYLNLGARAGLWREARLRLAAGAFLIVLVQGHGIHLAANAIAGASNPGAAGWQTTYFLDEHWGHAEIHLAVVLMAALFILAARPAAAGEGLKGGRGRYWLLLLAVVHGLFLAADAIEGQTVPLMIGAGVVLPALARRRCGESGSILPRFFGAAFATALVVLVAYGVANGGYPELPLL